MLQKVSRIIFIVLFFLLIAVPFAVSFFSRETIAVDENRMLAKPPVLFDAPKVMNRQFLGDAEKWVNDHIGFRTFFLRQKGLFHYYVYHKLPVESPNILGPEDELNYGTREAILDYQHRNLYGEADLDLRAESMEQIGRYLKENNIQFYYYQCWDKHSIYPEHFPKEILQYGTESKTDGIVQAFQNLPDVTVISPKQELTDAKLLYETYSRWGDPTHWTQRGAYIGYRKLMEELNRDAEKPYDILSENDYDITVKDWGRYLYGRIHQEDLLEEFEIRDPKAESVPEKLTVGAEHPRSRFFINPKAPNRTCLLIFGDSYFHEYILDDIAESFYETVFLWGDQIELLPDAVAVYQPDLVIVENAEREDRTGLLISCAEKLPD